MRWFLFCLKWYILKYMIHNKNDFFLGKPLIELWMKFSQCRIYNCIVFLKKGISEESILYEWEYQHDKTFIICNILKYLYCIICEKFYIFNENSIYSMKILYIYITIITKKKYN